EHGDLCVGTLRGGAGCADGARARASRRGRERRLCQSLLWRLVLVFALFATPWLARAAGCVSAQPAGTGMQAARIAALACRENALWYSPFIDANGRLASNTVSEAEGARLGDGATPAWMRVVEYW